MQHFDVYEPNSRFGRKTAGPPNFRVAVRAPCGPCGHPFLGLEEMAAAERASPGGWVGGTPPAARRYWCSALLTLLGRAWSDFCLAWACLPACS